MVTVIPISSHQDTVGPMCRSVADAAAVLTVIAGRDPRDNCTLAQPPHVPDFSKALDKGALKGARLGVPRLFQGTDPSILAAFNTSLEVIKGFAATSGATIFLDCYTSIMLRSGSCRISGRYRDQGECERDNSPHH